LDKESWWDSPLTNHQLVAAGAAEDTEFKLALARSPQAAQGRDIA